MAQDISSFLVTIPSHLAYVGCARVFVVAVCKAHCVDDTTTESIALAVHEALTNVVRHAHRHEHDKPIRVYCAPYPDRLEIHILDQGDPFDVNKVPDLDPSELRVGGRGVFLMRTLFDQVSSDPLPEGGNHLCLVKRCTLKIPAPLSD